jgi:hypothetical protein
MAEFNPAKSFEIVRAESKRKEEAADEANRRSRAREAAFIQRLATFHGLLNLFPGDDSARGTLDVQAATDLMVKYAQTLPTDGIKAVVESVSGRMAELAAGGKTVEDAPLKDILLNLLLFASEGNKTKVKKIFSEVVRGDTNEVEAFRHCLANWLAERVVEELPPLPDELTLPSLSPAEEPDPPQPDGPFDGKAFAWKGKVCRCLSPQQYRLMVYLWNEGRPRRSVTYTDLQENVWENREVAWETVKSAVSRLDTRLQEDGIYLGFETSVTYHVRVRWGGQE